MFKEGKIFGKINIIDLLIVLGLIGAVAFVALQFRGGGGVPFFAQDEQREFYIRFFAEEIEDFTVNSIEVGDIVIDSLRNVPLGTVTALDIRDARVWNADQDGNTVQSNKDGFSSIEITARLTAPPDPHGIMIAGNRYGVGHSLTIRAGRAVLSLRVSGLEEAGA